MAKSLKSAHVPAQYYGYTLQTTHCVFLLLEANEKATVSVEVFDDVATEAEDGGILAVQVKAAGEKNPISDRAKDLWKTFRNWLVSIEKGELDLSNTRFNIHLGRYKKGGICKCFSDAMNETEAKAAIEDAWKKLQKKAKSKTTKSTEEAEVDGLIDYVFSPTCAANLTKLVTRFTLTYGSGHAYEDLLAVIKNKLIEEELAEDVLFRALGWVDTRLKELIESETVPSIAVCDFRTELLSFRNRLKAREYLPSFAGEPSPEEIDKARLRIFVRQLNFINLSEEQVMGAISDFLKAKSDRVTYAQRGYVHSDSLREFAQALVKTWSNLRDEIELDATVNEKVRGARLALRCLRQSPKLQGIEVVQDFTRGCFHHLADFPRIGWHPRYAELLAKKED